MFKYTADSTLVAVLFRSFINLDVNILFGSMKIIQLEGIMVSVQRCHAVVTDTKIEDPKPKQTDIEDSSSCGEI